MVSSENVVIEAGLSAKNYWRDLWRRRELLWILAKRDLSVRYKQTLIGAGWSVIRPFATMIVMVFAFKIVAKIPPDPNVPYELMVLAGITIWNFFSTTFSQVSHSVLVNGNLVSKVYFPRLIMPISSVVVGLVDFLIAIGLYFVISLFLGNYPTWHVIFLPFFLLLSLGASLAFGLFVSVLNVRFRDIAQLIPFLVQIGMYACPVVYSSRLVEQNADKWWYQFYYYNPMVGIIDGFRWCLLDGAFFKLSSLYSSVGFIAVLLIISIYFFRKKENSFVDYL
jgi:lipopolysaccharide transport system permease protein